MTEPATNPTGTDNTRPSTRFGRLAGLASRSMLVVGILALVLTGFAFTRFVSQIGDLNEGITLRPADGIVVLTGDGQRIETALDLLEAGHGKRLLISGVHRESSASAIRKAVRGRSETFECCVDIDRAALDTVGNAEQTDSWARRHGFRTLIVVTSDYHMPRSLLELRSGAPEIDFTPYPVVTASSRQTPPLSDPRTLRRIVPEFAKYLAARIRLGLAEGQPHTAFASLFLR